MGDKNFNKFFFQFYGCFTRPDLKGNNVYRVTTSAKSPWGLLKTIFSRKALVKLGISSHKLLIETGRYDNKLRDELYFILFFLGPVQTSIFSCTRLMHVYPFSSLVLRK